MAWLLGGEAGPSGQLLWTSPDWVVVLAAAIGLLALGLAVGGRRPLGLRLAELACWALALAGLVVALAGPTWVEEEGRTEPGRLVVLVDASASMGVLEDGTPRADAVQGILDRIGTTDVEVLHFGDDLAAGPPLAYDAPDTDFTRVFGLVRDRYAGERLAGVVLLSDGLDRGSLRAAWADGEEPVPPELPGPLTVFQVGETGQLSDLAVQSVDVGGYAYIHAPFRLRATLRGLGFEGRTVDVDLLRDGQLAQRRSVALDAAGDGEVVFEVRPDVAGRFTYVVQVPSYDGDAVPGNNSLPVVVRVVRDRIRVLQVAGAPSWDVKFLRRFLKGDPSVDLVSFFILRTQRDLKRRYRDDELALIQFPYEQLFDIEQDLATFDLVVFQNFDHRPYFRGQSNALLDNLRTFVEDRGHGFVMVGGNLSFSQGAYGGTPLGDILPVTVSPAAVEPSDASFVPRLTEAGQRHPLTRLTPDPAENAAWWSRLSAVDGTNRVTGAAPGASVLLTHPELTGDDGRPQPVLAVREVGEGRTMALTLDTSWRWSMAEAAEGRGNQAYLRFWKNAIRWLIADPSTERVSVDTARENYGLGDAVRVVVTARDPDFAPLPDATVEAVVQVGGETQRFEGVTDEAGEVALEVPAARRGAHRVRAEVSVDGKAVGEASTVFAVTDRDPELDEVAPDRAFLSWLAARSDGSFHGPGEAGPVLRDPDAGRVRFDRSELDLSRSPLLALWTGLFAGLAWVVRRRAGLR